MEVADKAEAVLGISTSTDFPAPTNSQVLCPNKRNGCALAYSSCLIGTLGFAPKCCQNAVTCYNKKGCTVSADFCS